MATLAGIFFFDGRPAGEACQSLATRVAPMAPDGVRAFSKNGIAMVYGAFDVWAGDESCTQPRRLVRSGLVMTWDGRLDNRDDLLMRFGRPLRTDGDDATADDLSDASIALTLFERGGVEELRSLVGDWSLAVWDERQRTLHLARDYMGVRPLYYCATSDAVMWSSDLGELAERTDRLDTLDERFVARFMTLRFSTDVTPYEGIRSVPTASCVSFSTDTGAETRRRFWSLQPATIRYPDPRQYEEHLRALWREAVGGRLRTEGTVWAELSGGLDSSSVVCMADALVKNGLVSASGVQPISYVSFQSPGGDERTFIAEVEARIGVRSVILSVEEHQHDTDSNCEWVTPLAPAGMQVSCAGHVRGQGGRIILSGRAGDVIMGCLPDNSVAVADDIRDWRLINALSNLRRWSLTCRRPAIELAANLARKYLTARMRPPSLSSLNETQQAGLDLLTTSLQEISHERSGQPGAPLFSVSKQPLAVALHAYSLESRLSAPMPPGGVIYSFPYVHRPLVEFMLAVPGEQLSAPNDTRSLMRRAFQGLLPPRVQQRVSKGHYPPAAMRALRPRASSLLPVRNTQVVRRGWVDPLRLEAAIRALTDGGGRTGNEIQRLLRLESWLRCRDRRGPAANQERKEVKRHAVRIA